LADADAVLFVLDGTERVGPGDRYIARALRAAGLPAAVAVNKADRLGGERTAAALLAAAELGVGGEIFPVSARDGDGVEALRSHLVELLPEGPFLYPAGERSDQSEQVRIAELVREQVLRRTRQELPHAVEVEVVDIA